MSRLRFLLIFVVAICGFLQLLVDSSSENVLSAIIVVASTVVTLQYTLRYGKFVGNPLTIFLVIGSNFTTQSGALILKTLSFSPLAGELQVPVLTFGTYALAQLAIVGAHEAWVSSRILPALGQAVAKKVLKPVGFFAVPSDFQLWTMGCIGALATWYTGVTLKADLAEGVSPMVRFLQGFTFLTAAPMLIPFAGTMWGEPYRRMTVRKWVLLVLFLVAMAIIAMARNTRATFAMIVMTGVLIMSLGLCIGAIKLSKRGRALLVFATFFALLMLPVLSDLATAMVLVRSQRATADGGELINKTLDTYVNEHSAIADYRQSFRSLIVGYDYTEHYVDNPLLGRLISTKFHDNVMSVYDNVPTGQLWNLTIDKTLALFPTPMLALLGIPVEKERLNFSFGDFMYDSGRGRGLFVDGSAVSSYKLGSLLGHGLALMGGWFYFVLAFLTAMLFTVYRSFCLKRGGVLIIAPFAFLQIWPLFVGVLGTDSVVNLIAQIVRGLPQAILLYLLVFHLTGGFLRPIATGLSNRLSRAGSVKAA